MFDHYKEEELLMAHGKTEADAMLAAMLLVDDPTDADALAAKLKEHGYDIVE